MYKKLRLLVALVAAALTAAPVYAQDPKLLEAGKKEGKVTVYGSLETDSAEAGLQTKDRYRAGVLESFIY